MPTIGKDTASILPEKEVAIIKRELGDAESFANALVIKGKEDYETALTEGKSIKTRLEAVTKEKENISKPQYAAYKATLAFFKMFEEPYERALATIRNKMTEWKVEQDRQAATAAAKIEARVEKGTMKESTAGIILAEIKKENAATVSNEAGSATTKKIPFYTIADLKLIPTEFLKSDLAVSDVCDMKKVKASFDLEKPVAGIKKDYKNTTSFS